MQTSITKKIVQFVACVGMMLSTYSAFGKEATYKVGVGDVLEIKVFGESEFTGTFRVSSDGSFEYPFLRKISAEGKTTEELAANLTKLLRDGYLTDPQVSVEVKDFKSQNVLILGAVGRPGTYSLQEETRVIDLISKAGGIASNGGKKILLLRGKGLNKEAMNKLEVAQNETKPKESENTADAPSAPTNATDTAKEVAIVSSALNSPEAKPMIIDYYRLIHDGDFSQNMILRDGDILNVLKANEIFVLGNVGKPGPVPYEENMTILQAVILAGGPTPLASTKSTYILRQGSGGEQKLNVRLDKIMDNKAKNEILKADDVIIVPESFF